MKKYLLISAIGISCILLSSTVAMAQKGALMLYGSLNYQHNNQDGSSFGANPLGLGYFFNDHVVAGFNYAFSWEKNQEKIKIEDHHEIGPFYSDSWALGDHFVLIAQADAHYVWGDHLSVPDAYHGYLLRIYPIVAVMLGHGWALKAKFCELSYESLKDKGRGNVHNNTFIAGANGSTIGLGVSKNICLFKK